MFNTINMEPVRLTRTFVHLCMKHEKFFSTNMWFVFGTDIEHFKANVDNKQQRFIVMANESIKKVIF